MKEFRTMKYHFKASIEERKLLKFLCRISKNIYNCALYELRRQYFKDKAICSYFELNKLISKNNKESLKNLEYHQLENVILTGATGYLGAHILQELLDMKDLMQFYVH